MIGNIASSKPGTKAGDESYNKILNKMEILQADKRFEFLLRPDSNVTDNLASLVSKFFRIPTDGKPLSIIDLSGVPSDVVDVVVSVLCRTIFDFTLWNSSRTDFPLLLVCEEAHRYAPLGGYRRTDRCSHDHVRRACLGLAPREHRALPPELLYDSRRRCSAGTD